MKAAVATSVGERMSIEEVVVAKPKGREVLVRVVAAGLCHSDLLFLDGLWPHQFPTILGHEVSGVVEAIGPEVTHLAPGDHVLGCAGGPCYECRYCTSGRPILCVNRQHDRSPEDEPRLRLGDAAIAQYGQLSGFAEQLLIHEHACVKIPEDMPLELAAVVCCGVATGLGAVVNTARVPAGSSVVVTGVGGVGLNAIQGARIVGASKIIAVDINPTALELARRLGATHTVDASATDPTAVIRELTGGGADYVFETSGVAKVAEQSFHLLGDGATLTLVGLPALGTDVRFDITNFIPRELKVQGSFVGSLRPIIDLPRYCEMYLSGQLLLDELITSFITLDQVNEGFQSMVSGGAGRTVILFDK